MIGLEWSVQQRVVQVVVKISTVRSETVGIPLSAWLKKADLSLKASAD